MTPVEIFDLVEPEPLVRPSMSHDEVRLELEALVVDVAKERHVKAGQHLCGRGGNVGTM